VRGLALTSKPTTWQAAHKRAAKARVHHAVGDFTNARGPLIVDSPAHRLATLIRLAFLWPWPPPESPDWGSTINEGRKLLLIYAHPALPPAMAAVAGTGSTFS
jgi:peptide/nickel transport system permease protein